MALANWTYMRRNYSFRPYVINPCFPRTGEVPTVRNGHGIVSDNGCVYIFGGNNCWYRFSTAKGRFFKEIWKLNIAKGEWKRLDDFFPSLPEHLLSNIVLLEGKKLIVHGGTVLPFSSANTNKTFVADLKHNTLKSLDTKGNHPEPQNGQAMVLCDNNLYVFGRTTGHVFSSKVHCLDLKTKTWEEIQCSSRLRPTRRHRHEMDLYNSKLIVFGGATKTVCQFKQLLAFNTITKEWEYLQTSGHLIDKGMEIYPRPRRCYGSVQIPQNGFQDPAFIICGGFDGFHPLFDVWKINLRTLQWQRCPPRLRKSVFSNACSLSPCGQMFLFGGIGDAIEFELHRSYCLFSMWVTIPKLKEMCWEAILYYNPEIYKYRESKLLDSGVPKEFVDRIFS